MSEKALKEAQKYGERMLSGPLKEEDVAGHRHLLERGQQLEQAIKAFERTLSGDLFRGFDEMIQPTRLFLRQVMMPLSLLAEPVSDKRRIMPLRAAKLKQILAEEKLLKS